MWGQRYRAGPSGPNSYNPHHPSKNKHNPRALNNAQKDKIYICPGCLQNFDCIYRNGQFLGRVPLVLNCSHTVCQDCILKQCHSAQIACHTCKKESPISRQHLENLQELFVPNFYLVGYIFWSKSQQTYKRNMGLVPTQITLKNRRINTTADLDNENTERCCFHTCTKIADFHCKDCNDFYCAECKVTIHKSAKSMWEHKTVPISSMKLQFQLEKCPRHNTMTLEFYCNICEVLACCYCFLDDHEGHQRNVLSCLPEAEMEQFKEYLDKSKKILKQLRMTHKKILDLSTGNTETIQTKIRSYFGNLHAELYFIEKNLIEETTNIKNDNDSLESLSRTISSSISTIQNVVSASESNATNINVVMLFKILKDVENTPCYLLTNNGLYDLFCFTVDPSLEDIKTRFKLIKSNLSSFQLVTADNLPPDYVQDCSDDDTDLESHRSTGSAISFGSTTYAPSQMSRSNAPSLIALPSTSGRYSNPQQSHPGKQSIEKVTVTHVDSLESFYVQQKKFYKQLGQLQYDIREHVKHNPPNVAYPEMNEVYLVSYKSNNRDPSWLRGRVTGIKPKDNGELLCEVFFIDRGNTQLISSSRLKEITPSLAQRKPFAMQCQLHNPTYISWSKESHLHFAKLINKRDIHMLIKNTSHGLCEVELMISSSSGGLTSVTDLLINTCNNVLSSSEESTASQPIFKQKSVCSQDIKLFPNSVQFKIHQSLNVIIAYVTNPHTVYVHEASNSQTIKNLTQELKKFYKNNLVPSCIPVPDTYVVVQYNVKARGQFHRALVKNVDLVKDKVDVFLVDWGITASLPTASVKMLSENFTRLECQAIMVKLAHIAPYNMVQNWSPESIAFLEKFFFQQDVLKMSVYSLNPLEVVLFEEYGTIDFCVNAQMVEEHLADCTGKLSSVREWPQVSAKSEQIEDTGLIGDMLKNVHLNSDDEDDEIKGVPQLVEVSRFVDPDLIYIKFGGNKSNYNVLCKELQVHYTDFKERIRRDSWDVNDKCVIFHIKNNAFCRGKIVEVREDMTYKIYLIDSGHEEIVTKENIFVQHEYFNKFIYMAFKAFLTGIRPAGDTGKWATTAIEALEQIFKIHREIFVTKAGPTYDDKLPVIMWYKHIIGGEGPLDPTSIKYVSINNLLVKVGLAFKKNTKVESKKALPEESNDFLEEEPVKLVSEEKVSKSAKNKKDSDAKDDIKGSPYHKKELPMAAWIKPFRIDKPKFEAYITCADHETGVLYLHDVDLHLVYTRMEADLKAYFDENHPTRRDNPWEPGQICTISYQDKWYRGNIIGVKSDKEVEVVMIDFGSTHVVNPDDLYIEILFPDIPAFASKVTLFNVYPKCGKWLTSDHDILMAIIEEHADIVIRSPNGMEIPEADVYLKNGVLLNQELIKKSSNLVGSNSLLTETEGEDDSILIETEEIVEASNENDEIEDSEKISEFIIAKLPESVYNETSKMSIVNVLTYNTLILNHASSDDDYYTLFTTMTSDIQDAAHSQPTLDTIEIGQCCVCPYSEDGVWYRAKIHAIEGLDYGFVFVLFVDFGNIESVACSDLKVLKPEWFKLPVHTYIANVDIEISVSSHMDHVLQHMKKMVNKTKYIEVVKRDPLSVRILEDDGSLSYQSLIDKGLLKTI